MEVDDVIRIVRHSNPCDWVVITGGEPFYQEIEALLHMLKYYGYKIQVETNGTNNVSPDTLSLIDHLTVSSKGSIIAGLPITELKYVVTKEFKESDILYPASRGIPQYLQPESMRPDMMKKCLEMVKKRSDLRLSIQLHKILKIR